MLLFLNFLLSFIPGVTIDPKGGDILGISLTITISVILSLSALISPILVALINNHHNYKIRKLELATDNKIEKFERLCDSLIKYLESPTDSTLKHYKLWYSQSVIYMSAKSLQTVDRINMLISDGQLETVRSNYLPELCRLLQKDLGVYKRRK